MSTKAIWVVDRIEGAIAVLVRDADVPPDADSRCDDTTPQLRRRRRLDVPVTTLPVGVGEGTVLRVPEPDDRPAWADAVIDDDLRQARRRDAEARLRRLRRRDPGGDIVL